MQEIAGIGLVLDPRYKIRYLKFSLEETHNAQEMTEFLGKIRSGILNLTGHYAPTPTPTNPLATSTTSTLKNEDEDTFRFLKYMNGSSDGLNNDAPGAELDLYLEERNVGISSKQKFDILAWWKMNETRFPTLSKVAKVILTAPATSVASESAFSTGGRVLDDYRCRLNEQSVEALLCAQDWIK